MAVIAVLDDHVVKCQTACAGEYHCTGSADIPVGRPLLIYVNLRAAGYGAVEIYNSAAYGYVPGTVSSVSVRRNVIEVSVFQDGIFIPASYSGFQLVRISVHDVLCPALKIDGDIIAKHSTVLKIIHSGGEINRSPGFRQGIDCFLNGLCIVGRTVTRRTESPDVDKIGTGYGCYVAGRY